MVQSRSAQLVHLVATDAWSRYRPSDLAMMTFNTSLVSAPVAPSSDGWRNYCCGRTADRWVAGQPTAVVAVAAAAAATIPTNPRSHRPVAATLERSRRARGSRNRRRGHQFRRLIESQVMNSSAIRATPSAPRPRAGWAPFCFANPTTVTAHRFL